MPGADAFSPRGRQPAVAPNVGAPSWWVLGLAGVYVGYFVVLVSFEITARERLHCRPDPASGAAVVGDVDPGSVAARAGLTPGDLVRDVEGRPVLDILDWSVAAAHFPPDRPVEVVVERGGRRLRASLDPPGRGRTPAAEGLWLLASVRLPALAMALLLVWRRPRDPQALLAAWLLATFATSREVPPEGMAATWMRLPGPVAAVLWIPYASGLAFGGAILLTFTTAFPRPLFRRPWIYPLLWPPALAVLAWLVPVLARAVATGRTGPGDLQHVLRILPVNVLYLACSLTALIVGYRRLTDSNERRRVRVVVAGASVGLLVSLSSALLQSVKSLSPAVFVLGRIASLLVVLFPLSLAYAVLRHRLFDLRLVVRAGVRYAFARRSLLALVPLLAGALV
ncbi:MAG TPA: PDZ domain-containing protein, partial [Vicinamibacteria bacterium]|nr:PDZ domain-containing protein [Vicinamibacteria bacterium]